MSVEAYQARPFYEGWIIGGLAPGIGIASLSAPGVSSGSTQAEVFATTDMVSGTAYAVVTTSATPPSVAQVKAGQDHTGSAAAGAGSAEVTSTRASAVCGGLTVDTSGYYGYIVQATVAGDSLVASGGTFSTTASAGSTPFGQRIVNDFDVRY